MKNSILFSAVLLGCAGNIYAQEEKKAPLTVNGYAEAYYIRDFNNPLNNTRPSFVYSHNRTNEINLNLAFIKANYSTENVRANLALAAGTYMNANYSAEPGVLKNLYEANVGVKISGKHNLWIDAGVFSAHIGVESAVGKDNWTLTRSLFAENSPYFETGAKISYTSQNGKWLLSGLILNGWQRIQRVDGNTTPAFGHQVTFKPSAKLTVNSSSFIGNDKPDSVSQLRYFHNLYAVYQISGKFGVTAVFDIGAEQKSKGSSQYNTWYTPALIVRFSPTEQFSLAARGEYYQDKNGVIINTGTPNGIQTWGCSVNADYNIFSNVVWRIELRNLSNKNDAIYSDKKNNRKKNNMMAVTALAVSF